MTDAPCTWTVVFVPSPTSGRGGSASLSERVATRTGLVLLGWAERRRDAIRRSVRLDRAPRPTAQRPFC